MNARKKRERTSNLNIGTSFPEKAIFSTYKLRNETCEKKNRPKNVRALKIELRV